jgi:hypothetical protein
MVIAHVVHDMCLPRGQLVLLLRLPRYVLVRHLNLEGGSQVVQLDFSDTVAFLVWNTNLTMENGVLIVGFLNSIRKKLKIEDSDTLRF